MHKEIVHGNRLNQTGRRALALFLSCLLALSLLPVSALAVNDPVVPTVESIQEGTYYYNYIFANGLPLILAAGSSTTTNTVIYIDKDSSGTVSDGDEIFKPGNEANDTAAGNDLSSWRIYGGSYNKGVTGDTKITMTGGKVDFLYGGGLCTDTSTPATVTGSTEVTVTGGMIQREIYGGGKGGTVGGNTSVTVGGAVSGSPWVYGGGNNYLVTSNPYVTIPGTVVGDTSVTIEVGAEVNNVYGGGALSGVSGNTSVTVAGNSTSVIGGGSGDVTGSTSVTVSGTVTGEVVGGGSGGTVGQGTVVLIQSGASVKPSVFEQHESFGGDVYGGGTSGSEVTGGTAVTVLGTVEGSVYGGGRTGDGHTNTVSGSRIVTVGGAAKIGGENDGIVINSPNATEQNAVTNGVASFVIKSDDHLSSEAAVRVVLPEGIEANTVIATGAVTGDAAKIKLTGPGATNLEPAFKNNTIVVNPASQYRAEYSTDGGEKWIKCEYLSGIVAPFNNSGTAAQNKVRLLADTSDSLTVPRSFTLDLQGHTWASGSVPLIMSGEVVITDSVGNGRIVGANADGNLPAQPAISVKGTLTLTGDKPFTIQGGNGKQSGDASNDPAIRGASGINVQNVGTLVVETGASVTIQGGNSGSVTGGSSGVDGGDGVSVKNGTFSANGGTFQGGVGGDNSDPSKNGCGLSVDVGSVKISGGTFSGNAGATLYGENGNQFIITGGVFTGDDNGLLAQGTNASLSITGGSFSGGIFALVNSLVGSLAGGSYTGLGETAYSVSGVRDVVNLLAPGMAYYDATGQKITAGQNESFLGKNTTIRVAPENSPPTILYTISGKVTDSSDSAVSGATVKLMKGRTEVAQTTTNESGDYSFVNIEAGIYNVVATKDAVTMTILVQLTDANATEKNIKLPQNGKNSVVEVKEGAPAVVVGGVEQVAAAQTPSTGESVTVKLTVEQKDNPDNKEQIDAFAKGKTLKYLDISLVKVLSGVELQIANNTVVLELAIPYDFTNKQDVIVYRFHSADGVAMALAERLEKPSDPTDGTFWLDKENGYIHVYASKFSTYAIGYNTPGDGFTGIYVPSEKPLPFTDVKSSDWFYSAVRYVYERGIMLGSSDTSFSPATSAQRGMIAAILWRLEGSPAASAARAFSDVADSAYYARAVAWADANGLAVGYGNGAFGPMDAITREQLAAIIWRYAGSPDVGGMALAEFTDGGSVSPWAYKAMLWAVQQGVITGKDGALDPQGCATRAEVAAILTRYLQAK